MRSKNEQEDTYRPPVLFSKYQCAQTVKKMARKRRVNLLRTDIPTHRRAEVSERLVHEVPFFGVLTEFEREPTGERTCVGLSAGGD